MHTNIAINGIENERHTGGTANRRQKVTLVTGGAGFIGYNLCRRLLNEGDRVICMDNMVTGSPHHVEELRTHSRFEFVLQDVIEPIDLQVDRIFNLACPASPPAYQKDPIHTTLTSVIGARNILELAQATGARVVQASTSEVYGDPLTHPQSENYTGNVNVWGPRACYDEGKRCAETLCHDYRRMRGVDVRVARIFNTYGPGMRVDDGRVVSNFIVQSLKGEDITVYGDGTNTRSMCFVDDLVEGLIRLSETGKAVETPMNLGNPNEITVLEFAHLVRRLTGTSSQPVHLSAVPDDPKLRCPDIMFARNTLGWEPRISLEKGISATIAYFADLLQRPESGSSNLVAAS